MRVKRRNGFHFSQTLLAVLTAATIAIGCGEISDQEAVTVESSALNGSLIPSGGPLTRLTQTFLDSNEANRENETSTYYATVRTGPHGNDGGTIASTLGTFSAFKAFYLFGSGEAVTYYYNRGDLGIGREMHCIDKVNVANNGQIACYVTNFAAGDDGSEFTFGLSSNIAFSNLHAGNSFATVAMVYRDLAPAGSKDRVLFVVYDKFGARLNFAALDRHAISFKNGQIAGTPGANFNLHVPSNCVGCHGGQQYDSATHSQTGGLFLPFDLDQFDYENVAGRTRDDQLTAFKHQNEMVRKVAALSPTIGDAIKRELDAFYNNGSLQTPKTEVFEDDFHKNAVPNGWIGFELVYQRVVRPICRTCHVANEFGRTFDTETSFRSLTGLSVGRLCSGEMPHSLQSLRQFWQSGARDELDTYLRAVNPSAATTLEGCTPGEVVTLDPPALQAVLGPVVQ